MLQNKVLYRGSCVSITLFTGGHEARRTILALKLSPYLTSAQAGSLQVACPPLQSHMLKQSPSIPYLYPNRTFPKPLIYIL